MFVFNRILIQNLSESSTSEPVEDFKGFKKTRDFGDFQVREGFTKKKVAVLLVFVKFFVHFSQTVY